MRGVTGVVMALVALTAAPLWAQDDVRQQLDALRKEVETLKAEKVQESKRLEAPATAAKGESAELMAAPQAAPNPLIMLFKETKLSGFVDAGYTYNRHQPDNNSNVVRAFDNTANTFRLHNAQLNLERKATDAMIAGYRVELSLGNDADIFDASGDTDNDLFDVQEAYAQVLIPFIKGLEVYVGKFATLSGYEVIESKDNMQYSRGLLFTWAIPFTHTGVRAVYQAADQVKVTLGYMNGWDDMTNNNNAHTFEFQVEVVPMEGLKAYLTIYHGAEGAQSAAGPAFGDNTDEDGNKRTLIDVIVAYTFKQFTVAANFDWGREDFDDDEQVHGEDTATWNGYALYAKFQATDTFAASARFERFRDEETSRTGVHQNLRSFTLTLEQKIGENLIVRLEYRHDKSSDRIFQDSDHRDDKQDTIGAEVIVTF